MLRAALVSLPVLAAAIAFFVIADPYKVIGGRDDYYPDPATENMRVSVNKGMATVRNYERQVAQGRQYNAFIFGSSISCYYDPHEWARLLGGDVRPYHFDSSSETLIQMARKVEYLDARGQRIDYALVVLDPVVMQWNDENDPYAMTPPELEPSVLGKIKFYYGYFRSATNADFLKSYLYSKATGEARQIGRNIIFERQPIVHDPVTNHEYLTEWDKQIAHDPAKFYAEHPLMPSPAEIAEAPATINDEKYRALESIIRKFNADQTDYQVIIGPNRQKKYLNRSDLQKLQAIFGSERVHNFSRTWVNELETDTLLYDNVHYRPSFATRLLHATYHHTP